MSREYTYPHVQIPCPECHTDKYTLYDKHHAETYCSRCGLVINDTSLFSVTRHLQNQRERELVILRLWKKPKEMRKNGNQ